LQIPVKNTCGIEIMKLKKMDGLKRDGGNIESSSTPFPCLYPASDNIIIKLGKHTNTNWILKTEIYIRGHKVSPTGRNFGMCVYKHTHIYIYIYIYILKASRILGNITERTFSLVITGRRVPRKRSMGTADISYTL
jgi:hypothetical protein